VRGLELVLPDGLLIRAQRGRYISRDGRFVLGGAGDGVTWPVPTYPRPSIKNAGGPYSDPSGAMDLVDLVVGSEGLFGVVTSCTLDLSPRPASFLDLFIGLGSEPDAVALRHHLVRIYAEELFGSVSALEYFGPGSRRYMDHAPRFFASGAEVAIYLRVPRLPGSESGPEEVLEILLQAPCPIDPDAILVLDRPDIQRTFQQARHSIPANTLEVIRRWGTRTVLTDTAVPPEHFGDYLERVHALLGGAGVEHLSFGHLGDCHLHFVLLPEPDQQELADGLYDRMVQLSADLGGVYSGEHGTGKSKRRDFLRCYGADAVEQVRRCKAAVDKHLLLNRGNVLPS